MLQLIVPSRHHWMDIDHGLARKSKSNEASTRADTPGCVLLNATLLIQPNSIAYMSDRLITSAVVCLYFCRVSCVR